jgi:uncharacterized protein
MTQNLDLEFVEFVVKNLVDFPEKVVVTRKIDDRGVLLLIDSIDPRDIGKIIGKGGKVIESLRNLVRVLGMRLHTKLHLKINEPEAHEKYGSTTFAGPDDRGHSTGLENKEEASASTEYDPMKGGI